MRDEFPISNINSAAIRIGSRPTILYFDLYLYSAYAAHYVYFRVNIVVFASSNDPQLKIVIYLLKHEELQI